MRALTLAIVVGGFGFLCATAAADPLVCQKKIAKQYTVFKKKTLKGIAKCLDKENAGKLEGPCPDPVTATKLETVRQKVELKVATACSMSDAAALGFRGTCQLAFSEGSGQAAEMICSALPVTTSTELAACLSCWKLADFREFLATLYASHAVDLCGGTLGGFSTVCSQGGCASPTDWGPAPDQRDLGIGSENDCQRGIAKAGISYVLKREKLFEKCALAGGTSQSCDLAIPLVPVREKLQATIRAKCRKLGPLPDPPFCCAITAAECVAAADRESCEAGGGGVEEERICGVGGNCESAPALFTWWWSRCARRVCGDLPITTLDHLIDCVADKATEMVEGMLCYQFPSGGWHCPSSPSGAFLD